MTTTIFFKAKMSNGTVVIGPVQGNGGKLGNADLYRGYDLASEAALLKLGAAIRCAMRGRDSGLYEPEPHCVAMYPDYSAESDGDSVIVPLLGTSWSVVAKKEENRV